MIYWILSYEEEGSTTPPEPTASFTQEQVNAFNKAERLKREKAEAELKETKALLDSLKNEKNLSESEKEELLAKLEEIEQSKMTEAEKRQLEIEKIKKTYEEEKNTISQQLGQTTKQFHDLLISRSVTEAALEGPLVAIDGTGQQALLVLKNQCEVNEEGQVIVKGFTWTDSGKSFTEDLPAKEAIQKMKTMDMWANFWKDPANPGWRNHAPGAPLKDLDVSKMSQAEYREARKQGKLPWASVKGK